jgi:protease I
MADKVLILTGDAAEDLDAMYPVFRLREAGYEVVVTAPTTKVVKLVVHDFEEGWDAYTERPGRHLPVDLAFADVDPEEYVALVIPGGRAPEYIRVDADCERITRHFFEADKPVGLICHGTQVPQIYGLLRGRTTSGYPPLAGDIINAGATYEPGKDVVDGNIVSCTGWPDLPEWSRAFMAVLEKYVASEAPRG